MEDSASGAQRGPDAQGGLLFDHEKLEVYGLAKEFLMLATRLLTPRVPRDLRDQLDRASTSILFNIGEGAGKLARADKQRFYEIARGSTLECATAIEVMHMRRMVTDAEYAEGRKLLLRLAQMLSRLCRGPRRT